MVGREGRITNGLSDHSSLECKNLGEHPEASPIRLGGTTRCSVIPGRDPGSILWWGGKGESPMDCRITRASSARTPEPRVREPRGTAQGLGEHPEASPIRLGGTTRCSVIPAREPGSINPEELGWQSAVNLIPQIFPFKIFRLNKLDLPLSGPLFDPLFVVQS